jgi:hypothetical protein
MLTSPVSCLPEDCCWGFRFAPGIYRSNNSTNKLLPSLAHPHTIPSPLALSLAHNTLLVLWHMQKLSHPPLAGAPARSCIGNTQAFPTHFTTRIQAIENKEKFPDQNFRI